MEVAKIKDRALKISRDKLGNEVKDVVVEEEKNYEGEPSLRVTIILKSKWNAEPRGDLLNEISRQLGSYLSNNDDSRFAYTHYMTSREFSEFDDKPTTPARSSRRAG